MKETDRDAFIRWQGRTIEQMSSVSNLLIALATGLVAFEAQPVLDGQLQGHVSGGVWLCASLITLSVSLLLGLGLAWNRLADFRKTTRVVRNRGDSPQEADILREQGNALGAASWRLLTWQTVTFLVGTLSFVASILGRLV